jgi:hypothetical protein
VQRKGTEWWKEYICVQEENPKEIGKVLKGIENPRWGALACVEVGQDFIPKTKLLIHGNAHSRHQFFCLQEVSTGC